MAVERISIVITESGADRVVSKIGGIGTAAKGSANSVGLLKSALGALAVTGGLAGTVKLIDAYQNLQNRLGFINKELYDQKAAYDAVFQAANRSRTSVEATAELYTRVALAASHMKVSQQELVRVTETLNKATALSGANVRESEAALIQLSQGLASGALRGQELRSVLEQIPFVADLIAEHLGVTRGALRGLAQQGRLTSEVVLQALLNAGDKVDAAFGDTTATVEQQFRVLRNTVIDFLGKLNERFQILPRINKLITFLGDNIETVARVVLAGALLTALSLVAAKITALTVLIAANPLGALIVGIGAAVAALTVFGDKIQFAADSQATFADFSKALFEEIAADVKFLGEEFSEEIQFVQDLFKNTFGTNVPRDLKSFLLFVGKIWDNFLGTVQGVVALVKAAFNTLPASLELIFKKTINGLLSQLEDFINSVIDGVNFLSEKAGLGTQVYEIFRLPKAKLSADAEAAAEAMKTAFVQGFKDAGTPAQDLINKLGNRAEQIAAERIKKQAEEERKLAEARNRFQQPGTGGGDALNNRDIVLNDIIARLNEEAEALQYIGRERNTVIQLIKIEQDLRKKGITLTDAERDNLYVMIQTNDQLKLRAQIMDEVQGRTEENARSQEILNQLIQQGGQYTEQYTSKLRQLKIESLLANRDVVSGYKAGFLQVQEEITNFAQVSSDIVTNAFAGMEDAFVKFVTTGKLSFSSLIDSLLADIAKLLFRQAVVGLLSSLGGAGGILGSFAAGAAQGLSGARASGGPVSPGKTYLVGEKGPELFTPPNSGTIVPNGSMGGVAPAVNLTVVNSTDPAEVTSAMASADGEQVILNVIRRNKNSVKQTIGG